MRQQVLGWLKSAIDAVDPERITFEALADAGLEQRTLIAIGKAAPAMCRGAAMALGSVDGVCVAASAGDVPEGIELLVGEHPIPGEASLAAGRRVLEVASSAENGCIALVSGGGSSLCEWPRDGVDLSFLQEANRRLLMAGASIAETNLVRGHLSAIKCGGLARASRAAVATFVLSDVADAGPEFVASGPTLEMKHDPDRAEAILSSIGMAIPAPVVSAIRAHPGRALAAARVEVIADGRTAADAVADAARREDVPAGVYPGWITGDPDDALGDLLDNPVIGVTVGAGETSPQVVAQGRGGRNTHAALLAATRIAGTEMLFGALATDGVDGSSRAAGAIVDGETVARGGDPHETLAGFDSATYLERTGDLVVTGPTGTNVADLWLVWRP